MQREIFRDTTLEVNYIGNKGTHLLMRRQHHQALPPDLSIPLTDPRNAVVARRPYANFSTYIDSDWSGNSSYNAMNVKFERRTNTMATTVVYTWAKSLDTKSAAAGIGGQAFNGWQGFLNNHDPKRDRGRSDFDVDHRLVASFVYELPFGRGKRYSGNLNKAADAVLGGWQVNGIATFQKGFPITITAADAGGLLDTFGTNRANLVGDPKSGATGTIASWFNKSAFAQPAAGVFGSSGRNILARAGHQQLRSVPVQELPDHGAICASSSGWSRSMPSIIRSSAGRSDERDIPAIRADHQHPTCAHQSTRSKVYLVTASGLSLRKFARRDPLSPGGRSVKGETDVA